MLNNSSLRRSAAARRLFIPVCATLAAALPNSASAQAEPAEPTTPAVAPVAPAAEEAAVAAPVTTLPPLIVTARRVPESPVEVPAYAQVITRAQIRESGAATLIDLLERESNLHFTSIAGSPTNTKVSLRGTGTGGNGRTLILVDGVRANRADIGDFNWLQFSLQDIESIEVVQGPQGAFFGDNAVGGVIKINTLGKPSASGGSAQVLVGGDDTVKLGASYTELFGRAWASASLGYENSGGWRDHSGYDSVSGSVGFGHDNEKNSVTRVRASFLDNSYDQPGYLTPAQFQQDPTQAGTNSATGESSYRRVTASNEFGASAETKLLTDLGVSFIDEYFLGGFGTAFDRDIQGVFVSPKLHLERGPFTLTPGIDFNHERLAVDVNGIPPTRARLTRQTVGPFLAAEWKANEQVAVSAAVRREWNSIAAREQISGARADRTDAGEAYQLAVNWRPRPELRLYAKYDHVFRFPATDEMAYYQGLLGGPFGTPVFFNANLRPEVSDNVELGGDYCGERWGGGASVYHLATEDEIFYNAPTNLNENLAETRRVGAQANLGYDAGFAALRSRVDYVDASLTDAPAGSGLFTGPLRMTPEWRLTTTATLRPVERVEIGLTHRYIDGSAVDDSYAAANPDQTKAASLFDVRVSYRLNEAWRLFAGANNVFDKNHVSYSTIGYPPPFFPPTTVVYPGQGRWLYAGASLRF